MRIAVIGFRDRDKQHIISKCKKIDTTLTVDVLESYGESSRGQEIIKNASMYDYVFVNCKFINHATSIHINRACANVVNYFGGVSKLVKLIRGVL